MGPELIGGGLSLLGNIFGANASADAQKADYEERQKQLQEQQREFDTRQKAFEAAKTAGQGYAASGEQGLMATAGQALPELEQAKKDVLSGSARGINQAASSMNANLVGAGMRGGQLGTALRQGIGEMGTNTQENLNKMSLDDATRRQNAILALQAAKAGTGYNAATRTF